MDVGVTGSEPEPPVLNEAEEESAKRQRRRAKIVQEILDTERTYQNHLELVIQYFEGPLHDLKLVPDHVIVTIFSNIRQILSINQELLEHLGQIGIGQAFLRMGPFFKLYSTYANNHERALGAMIEWEQKVPEFGVWRRAQEELPAMMGLKINSLLITPVQRVPRYKMLLEDLMGNTEKSHEDFSAIEEAVKQISAVASHINEHIKQHDNFNKMLAIQKCLAGPGAPRILTPGRIFIKDGPLKKVSKKRGRPHERMFFLFSDIFMYAKPKFVDQVLSGSYVCCCIFPLHHCRVDTVFGHSQSSGSLFTVTCKEESLLLYSDQKSVQSWMTTLKKAIDNVKECRKTLRKPSSALQPLRRPALIQMRKKQKKDPLETARRTPDRGNPSPKSLKRALAEANINCLTPRRTKIKKADNKILQTAQQTLSPVISDSDVDSPKVKSAPASAVKGNLKSPQSHSKTKSNNVARKFMKQVRNLSNKKEIEVDEREKENGKSPEVWVTSPELAKQGPHCNISEILDPQQEKWDIFDTAPPDTSVVWRPRLPTDPPEMERPNPAQLRRLRQRDKDVTSRPTSEISANTSRIWRSSRPFSDVSDLENSTQLHETIQTTDDSGVLFKSPGKRESRTDQGKSGSNTDRYEFNEDSPPSVYCNSSRDFLESYTGGEGSESKRGIFHKQSDSMLLPWRTEWSSNDSESTSHSSHEAAIPAEEIQDLWWSSGYPGSVYAGLDDDSPTNYSIPSPTLYHIPAKRLCAIDEQSDTSPKSSDDDESRFRYETPEPVQSDDDSVREKHNELSDNFSTPQRQPKSGNRSQWRHLDSLLETTGDAAQTLARNPNIILSPVVANGNNCMVQ